jgi:uncharacterized protein (DUF58 family)
VPTREGTVIALLVAALFLLATNLMSGLLFVLDAMLASLLLVGGVTAMLPLRGLQASRQAPARAVEGEPVVLDVTLTPAHGGRFLIVEDGWEGARVRAVVPHVARGTRLHIALPVTPARRGRHTVGPIDVVCRGTVGLFAARRRLHVEHRITIWPRTQPVPPQALAQLAPALEASGTAERTREREDLYGLREYQPGDDLSRIHWRSSARRGTLVVREFERPLRAVTTVVLDLDRRQGSERLDAAVRAAASVLRLVTSRGADVVLTGWEDGLVERRDWEAAMDWLSGVTPSGPPLTDVLQALDPRSASIIAVASTTEVTAAPAVTLIVPADDAALPGAAQRLIYRSDGTVLAW